MYTDPHQKKLLKKWGMILESGTPIRDERTKVVLAQILENTRNYYVQKGMLNEAGVPTGAMYRDGAVGASRISKDGSSGVLHGKNGYAGAGVGLDNNAADYYLPNVVMPMLRRIMPDLIANDLVSVQPLNGPVGFALAYRPTYGSHGAFGALSAQDAGYEEIGYSPVDTRWTGTSSDVISSGSYWDAYFGGDARWNGEATETGAAEYAALGDNYPTISFGLLKSTVEARTRKLAAHWSPELAEDMQAMHGIDVEQEMVNTITYETGAEIDRQIVTEMVKAAILGGSTSDWTPISADGLDQMGRLATLLTQITVEAQNIAIRTKRGAANFVITTPRICALLQ